MLKIFIKLLNQSVITIKNKNKMQTLQIDKNKAIKLYPTATPEFKAMLEDSFGKDFFNLKITDRVKTFEDALAICPANANQKILLDYNGIDGEMLAAQAHLKICIIARALNEGWVPNWTNSNEYKYRPWFDMSSGSGLSSYDFTDTRTAANVGSRLCFKTAELAKYAGTQFIDIYKTLFII